MVVSMMPRARIVEKTLLSSAQGVETWLALDEVTQRPFVLKTVPITMVSESMCKRVHHEGAMLRQLGLSSTDGTITGQSNHELWCASPYVEGITLTEHLVHHNDEIHAWVSIILDVLKHLVALHTIDILHRNIKPSNIIIDAHGGAHLIDFLMSKVSHNTSSIQAQPVSLLRYLAPEQLEVKARKTGGKVGITTDIYAVGLLLYECIMGHAMHQDESINALLRSKTEHCAMDFCGEGHTFTETLRHCVHQATHVRPDLRYPTARKMLADVIDLETHVSKTPSIKGLGSSPVSRPKRNNTSTLGTEPPHTFTDGRAGAVRAAAHDIATTLCEHEIVPKSMEILGVLLRASDVRWTPADALTDNIVRADKRGALLCEWALHCAMKAGQVVQFPGTMRMMQDDAAYQPRFILGCPLVVGRKLLGCIQVAHANIDESFVDRDLEIANLMISMASASLSNAEVLASLKVLSAQRLHLRERAEENVRARDAFISVASHELKTPLSALHIHAQILLRQERIAAKSSGTDPHASLNAIERQVQRMNRLVTSLLDVGRIATKQLALDRGEIDLAGVARNVIADMEPALIGAECKPIIHAQSHVVGFWDRARLEQILMNLLSNAIRHGAGKPIEVLVEKTSEGAQLHVRDHGEGIMKENQEWIFDRFEHMSSERNYGGFGIGLWVVRQLVEAHGGHVSLASDPGHGSTFSVHLPMVMQHQLDKVILPNRVS